MCGIAGIYDLVNNSNEDNNLTIRKMTDLLAHRGPDDVGYFNNDKIFLGHRRLSILDLSVAGHQPMTRGDLVIVFNGEIYNYLEIRQELREKGHKFKSDSDTEVILAAYEEWGIKCLDRFNGMWAFVIYDQKNDLVFGSRDRFGVKPFYYFFDKESFVFASEIKALLAYPDIYKVPNNKIVWDYIAGGQVNTNHETFFKNIFELPSGSFFVLKDQKLEIKKFWDLKKTNAEIPSTLEEQIKKFREIFIDSVKIRLRSDVPIGTCLSGGLDSTAIATVINKLIKESAKIQSVGDRQKTFSACFKERGTIYADESQFIEIATEYLQTKSFYVYPTGRQIAQEIKSLVYNQDEPFASTSMFAQRKVFDLAREHDTIVVLDGQGSDELLGGYHTFVQFYLKDLFQRAQLNTFFYELMSFCKLQKINSFAFFFDFLSKSYLLPGLKKLFNVPDFVNRAEYKIFKPAWLKKYQIKENSEDKNFFNHKSYEFTTSKTLPGYLRSEDRNSMTYAVESRLPFLDYRLAEYIYNLPNEVKIRDGQTKWILREALKDLLPTEIKNRQDKKGFTVPEAYWFKHDLKEEIRQIFASESFNNRGIVEPGRASLLFEDFLQGKNQNHQLIWRLYNLEIWYRNFIDLP